MICKVISVVVNTCILSIINFIFKFSLVNTSYKDNNEQGLHELQNGLTRASFHTF